MSTNVAAAAAAAVVVVVVLLDVVVELCIKSLAIINCIRPLHYSNASIQWFSMYARVPFGIQLSNMLAGV